MGASVKVTGGRKWKAALKPYTEHPNGGVLIGVTDRDTYAQGPAADTGLTVAQNLAWHEFGTSRMPARAPLRSTAGECKREWVAVAIGEMRKRQSVKDAINIAGRKAALDVQKRIERAELEPPLNEKTVQRKVKMGYAVNAETPVLLTGTLQRAIQSKWYDDLRSLA